MLLLAFHSCWAHWSYWSLLVQRSPCSSPVGYLRRAKVAKVMYHTLLGCLSCAALCIPRRKGKSFWVNHTGHLTDGSIPDWLAGCSRLGLSSSSLPQGSEQPLVVSYGCWPQYGDATHTDEVCRIQATDFSSKGNNSAQAHAIANLSCVPTCQVICHIVQTVAVMHRELARVNIFHVRNCSERQRKISILMHRLCERKCSCAEQSTEALTVINGDWYFVEGKWAVRCDAQQREEFFGTCRNTCPCY